MLFNRASKHDFVPELYLTPGNHLEVVENMKLVGYQLRFDLRTVSNTQYMGQTRQEVKRPKKRFVFLDFSLVSRHDITYFEAQNGFYPTNTPRAPI